MKKKPISQVWDKKQAQSVTRQRSYQSPCEKVEFKESISFNWKDTSSLFTIVIPACSMELDPFLLLHVICFIVTTYPVYHIIQDISFYISTAGFKKDFLSGVDHFVRCRNLILAWIYLFISGQKTYCLSSAFEILTSCPCLFCSFESLDISWLVF